MIKFYDKWPNQVRHENKKFVKHIKFDEKNKCA